MQTTFPSLKDIKLVYQLVEGQCKYLYPLVPYRKIIISEEDIDETHLEISETRKRFSDIIQIRAFVAPSEETHPQSKFGLEKIRNIEVSISVPDMIKAGLAVLNEETKEVQVLANPNDLVEYSTFEYEIKEVRRGKSFANTDIPIFFEFTAERRRIDSAEFAGV